MDNVKNIVDFTFEFSNTFKVESYENEKIEENKKLEGFIDFSVEIGETYFDSIF